MLDLDEKGSNLSPSVYIVLMKWVSLFLGVFAEKKMKSLVLIKRKAMEMSFKE